MKILQSHLKGGRLSSVSLREFSALILDKFLTKTYRIMKLHLPVTLLRAVMALFATTITFTSAWAEDESTTEVVPREITSDVSYGTSETPYNGDDWHQTAIKVTSRDEQEHSIMFDGNNLPEHSYWGESVVSVDELVIEKLKNVTFTNNINAWSISQWDNEKSAAFIGNSVINITNNKADMPYSSRWGGAIHTENLIFEQTKESINITGNSVTSTDRAVGGAISNGEDLTFRYNEGAINISNNSIANTYATADVENLPDCVYGGAIFNVGTVLFDQNAASITFEANSATSVGRAFVSGGAISVSEYYADGTFSGDVLFSGNSGNIIFKDNSVNGGTLSMPANTDYPPGAVGGAIFTFCGISIEDNTSQLISFSGNTVEASYGTSAGGALHTFNSIKITGNKPGASPAQDGGESSPNGVVFDSNAVNSLYGVAKGGAISSDNSVVADYSDIPQEVANQIFPNLVNISQNGDIAFTNNRAVSGVVNTETSELSGGFGAYGGAIYSEGDVILGYIDEEGQGHGNGNVEFIGNSAGSGNGHAAGGAIYSSNDVKLTNNGDVLFGGALQGEGNTAQGYEANGGAIYSGGNVAIGGADGAGESQGNGDVTFAGNSAIGVGASAKGGAISSPRGGVSISGNGAVTFSGNSAIAQTYAGGGAIHVDDTDGKAASVEISNNTGAVTFKNNHAIASISSSRGGAICNYATEVIISGNTYGVGAALPAGEEDIQYSLAFTGNIAGSLQNSQAVGGAIYSIGSTEITGNGNILFGDNIVFSAGGDVFGSAIGTDQGGLFIDGNLGCLTVEGNQVYAVGTIYNSDGSYYGQGARLVSGAVTSMTTLSISRNAGDIVFSGNSIQEESATLGEGKTLAGSGSDSNTISITAGAAVGAMSDIYLDENQGNISFIGNTITSSCKDVLGGAIASATGDIRISNNNKDKAVVFSGNSVTSTKSSAKGGAIGTYAYDPNSGSSASVVIANNGSITFSDNSVVAGVRDQDGNIVSYHNIARGGAIYSEGDVELSYNGAVSFGGVILDEDGETVGYENGNIVQGEAAHGGAVYSIGDVTLSHNSSVSFYDNALEPTGGDAFGGAIYSAKSVSIENNTNGVNFSGNTITCVGSGDGFGGAIYAGLTSGSSYANADFGHDVTLRGNGNVTFADNKIVSEFRARGGAIYADGYITLSGNGDVTFSGNSVKSDDGGSAIGGAIATYLIMGDDGKDPNNYATIPVGVTLSGNGAITFSGNSSTAGRATANGGAIYSAGKVEMTGNSGNILFSGNSNEALSAYSSAGGAIAGFNGVVISDNTGESIRFENNLNKSNGGNAGAGAVYAAYNNVSIIDNKGVAIEFNGNRVEGVGRFNVLETDDSITTVDAAVVGGGAIGTDSSSVIIKNNGAVSFTDNVVVDNDAAPETTIDRNAVDVEAIAPGLNVTGGGAIMSMANTEISGNAGVTISGNSATSDSRTAMGGAIAAVGSASISHNKGDVNVSGNYAASKTGTAMGGAIFAQNGLSIVNNEGNVTFSGNYVKNGDNHQLNSVVVQGGKVELAAVEGKSISFYDSVLVGAGSEKMVLNSYTDASGQKQTSSGAIVFSGANAVETLQQLKGEGGTVSAGEISASLTSQINREVSVAGGSLQVKDGAVLRMQSLGVNNGADLLIGAGSTVAVGSTVTFGAGSEYTVLGLKSATTLKLGEVASSTPTAQIDGNIVLTAGMTYTMDGAYTELVGSANTLAFEGSGTYTFNVDESVAYTEGTTKYFVLFTGVDTLTGAELSTGVDPTLLSGIEFLTNIGYYDDIMLHYLNHETAGGVLYISATVPEPTTATLSLLALAALAARRRRK